MCIFDDNHDKSMSTQGWVKSFSIYSNISRLPVPRIHWFLPVLTMSSFNLLCEYFLLRFVSLGLQSVIRFHPASIRWWSLFYYYSFQDICYFIKIISFFLFKLVLRTFNTEWFMCVSVFLYFLRIYKSLIVSIGSTIAFSSLSLEVQKNLSFY